MPPFLTKTIDAGTGTSQSPISILYAYDSQLLPFTYAGLPVSGVDPFLSTDENIIVFGGAGPIGPGPLNLISAIPMDRTPFSEMVYQLPRDGIIMWALGYSDAGLASLYLYLRGVLSYTAVNMFPAPGGLYTPNIGVKRGDQLMMEVSGATTNPLACLGIKWLTEDNL